MIKLIVLSIKRMTKCAFCECALCEFLNSEEFKLDPQYEDNIYCLDCALNYCLDSKFYAINDMTNNSKFYAIDNMAGDNMAGKCARCEEFLNSEDFKLDPQYEDNIYCLDCALKYCFDSKFYTINDMTNNSTFYVIDNMARKCVCCEEFLNSVEFKFLNSEESKLDPRYEDNRYCLDCALHYCVSNAHEAGAQYDYYRHEITFCNYDKEKITYWSDKFNFILENYKKKCMTPCIPCPMIDSSWHKELGYNEPCYCAFKESFMKAIIYPEIEYEIDDLFIKTNTYSYVT